MPNPLKVFLCHAHADHDRVYTLYLDLKKDGVDAWLDKENLLPGSTWELEIYKAVRESDVVVVCLSKQFNQAGYRQKEVQLALDTAMEKPEGEIFIIPARLEECENLARLRKWHWVDLFRDDGYKKLMRALHVREGEIGRYVSPNLIRDKEKEIRKKTDNNILDFKERESDTFDEVKKMIVDLFDVDEKKITPNARLREDLGIKIKNRNGR